MFLKARLVVFGHFLQRIQSICQGIGDGLWCQIGWPAVIFNQGQQGLVVLVHNVPKVQPGFVSSHWRLVSIDVADNSYLCVVARPEDVDIHVEVPRC